ncbi:MULTISPECIES: hypothetical protein [unclassified Phenylobacterium]|uniref:hypothetical protein n=1 Tax=unclassified Phenylobacterium TaxID=2640670 RepID=UPI00083A20CE|nr:MULTISPECIES: hypothetical protein [unclassified Phenylobacterium]
MQASPNGTTFRPVGEIERKADGLHLRSAKARLIRIKEYVSSSQVTNGMLPSLVTDLPIGPIFQPYSDDPEG